MFKKYLSSLFFMIVIISGLLSAQNYIAENTTENFLISLSVGSSKIMKFNFNIINVAVGNSEIADVIITAKREILINGTGSGITSLTLWDNQKSYDYQIAVDKNSDNIKFKIYKLHNVNMVSHTITDYDKMMTVESEPVKENVEDLKNILSAYLDENKFSVNPWTNSVLVVGTEQEQAKIAKLINDIDIKEKQVVFKVQVYEMKKTDSLENSLELFHQRDQGTLEYDKSDEGFVYTYSSGAEFVESATHILKSLQVEGKAEIIANPKIICLNSHYSYIHAGEKFPIVRTDAQGNETVEYMYAGVVLGVIPNINEDGDINCWLTTQVSSISGYSPQNGYPIIGTRETMNNVRLKNNGLLILGGLMKDTENENHYKIPVLGDLLGWIPVLGRLVNNEESEKEKQELIITITPEIIFDEPSVAALEE
jgi:type II secretory pathway component GspD/PulD (secretin)